MGQSDEVTAQGASDDRTVPAVLPSASAFLLRPSRTRLWWEIAIVLALSVGRSAV
ncbi:hypothetical protein [Microbacterium aurum]